jgi:hypothetical protein
MDEDDRDRPSNVTEITEWLERRIARNGHLEVDPAEIEDVPWLEFRRRPKPPREHLLGPLVVRGKRLVLGAATGEGKSTLVWWIVKALASGGHFLGWQTPRPLRVLVLDAEQVDDDLDRLLDEVGLPDWAIVHIISVPDGLSLDRSPVEQQRLEAVLAKGWDVVVLDPLYKLHTGEENDNREAKALMSLFDRWRTQYNFALIMPAHMRKRQGRLRDQAFTIDEISGASTYLRGAEVVLGLKLITDGLSHLYFFKSRGQGLPARTHWPLRFDRNTGFTLALDAAEMKRRDRELAVSKIRETMIDGGGLGCDVDTLIAACGRKRSFVFEVLKELNALSRTAPGGRRKLYFLPDVQPDQQDLELLEEPEEDDD